MRTIRHSVTKLLALVIIFFAALFCHAQDSLRRDISLDMAWRTVAGDSNSHEHTGFEVPGFNDKHWITVNVPHNWDRYEGYRRLRHGNRHGSAWYRKIFTVEDAAPGKRYFLWFEGVGSYATVWLNGKKVGFHAGGRTTFTIDITETVLLNNKTNVLAVRADHPAGIRDLPWVCGGCSEEVGFSEGSQPMGIFRPVHLIVTDPVRIEPFGVHLWNDTTVSEKSATIQIASELKNYDDKARTITLISQFKDREGRIVATVQTKQKIQPHSIAVIRQQAILQTPSLWSVEDPYCYTIVSSVREKNKIIDQTSTVYGIRWIRWPDLKTKGPHQFFLNGKPVFINGTAEYEHMIGQSHAFTAEQIKARVMQIKAAGFNGFRDAHQPHNLRYHHYWDQYGVLWWTQMAAHVWFDTPQFRKNFKTLLVEWVKERRNSPSLVLWGLENESTLPRDFAIECTALIRSLDPTTSVQRKVTTCNGGEGTDWDVPQNWTGTYGGDPSTYADDIQKQVLIGEYGAWRSLGLHTEDAFTQNKVASEERMTQLMETKIRLAESVKDKCSGQFHWLFTSHENPGRVQGGEGLRELDRVGPINYKGLLTPWGEPLDAYYMFRSNYAPKEKEPMVYVASHTWPDRWTAPGKKDSIIVYSNCEEVELFNDVASLSLGRKKHQGIGTHFQWDDVNIQYNVLYAVGYVDGKAVAVDYVVLNHLPKSPGFEKLVDVRNNITAPGEEMKYLFRVNCGGPAYVDVNGNPWMADVHQQDSKHQGSVSWADEFPGTNPFYASQRKIYDPIKGTADWPLFQSFRYGLDKLRYRFPLPDGEYWVELYFVEPWYGTGGGMDCTGWRLFDVAINNTVVLKDLDIWKEAGHDGALKKRVKVKVTGGELTVSFPRVAAGQALIAAIAIATTNPSLQTSYTHTPLLIEKVKTFSQNTVTWSVETWLDTGHKQYGDRDVAFSILPPNLYGATWIRTSHPMRPDSRSALMAEFAVTADAEVFIAMDATITSLPAWLADYEDTRTLCESAYGERYKFKIFRKRFSAGSVVTLGENGVTAQGNANMYSVMALPVTTMQPAVDLRPTVNYKIDRAHLPNSGVVRDTVLGKPCVTFVTAAGHAIEWHISLGVANLYALRFRYYHTASQAKKVNFKIVAADGSIMNEEVLEFHPVNEEKWKTVITSTRTMINAGNYKVVLTPTDAEGLSIRDLEIQ